MWQIMWAVNLIPEHVLIWIINIILFSGLGLVLLAFFTRWIPFINQYRLAAQILGIALLCLGLWARGGYDEKQVWLAKVRDLEEKIKIAEEKSAEVNTVIQKVYVDRVKIVKEKEIVVQEKIKEVAKIIDAKCEVAPQAIDLHNKAAETPPKPAKEQKK